MPAGITCCCVVLVGDLTAGTHLARDCVTRARALGPVLVVAAPPWTSGALLQRTVDMSSVSTRQMRRSPVQARRAHGRARRTQTQKPLALPLLAHILRDSGTWFLEVPGGLAGLLSFHFRIPIRDTREGHRNRIRGEILDF